MDYQFEVTYILECIYKFGIDEPIVRDLIDNIKYIKYTKVVPTKLQNVKDNLSKIDTLEIDPDIEIIDDDLICKILKPNTIICSNINTLFSKVCKNKNDNVNNIEFLLNCCNDIDINYNNGQALCVAIDDGNINIIKFLIRECQASSSIDNYPFCSACNVGRMDVIQYLYEECQIPIIELYLQQAAYSGNLNVLKYLIDKNGKVTTFVVIMGIKSNKSYIIDYLLTFYEDINFDDVFVTAAQMGNLKLVIFLLENKNIDITYQNYLAICVAADNNQIEIVKYLIEKGIDINIDNCYILRTACHEGYMELIKYAVEQGSDIHILNEYALLCSVDNNQADVVKYLLELGADIHVKNNYVLRKAIYKGYLKILTYAIQYNVNINNDIIINACKHGRFSIIEYLIINLNIHSDLKTKALNEAIRLNYIDIVKLLLYYGALPDDDSIIYAITNDNIDIIKTLKRQYNIFFSDEMVNICVIYGNIDVFKYIYNNSKFIHKHVLELASQNGHLDIVKYLIKNHIKYNINNAILLAIKTNHHEVANYLLNLI